MEDEDYVEGVELRARDSEGEAHEYRVKDYTKFEDGDGGHLRGVVFYVVDLVGG